jgi:F-type H+-transporting ATPase subunit b
MTVIPFVTSFLATSGATPLFAHHGGFGLNLNPLDTNLINLVIVIGVLVWFLKGFLGGMLERRREAILADLSDAEQRLQAATAAVSKAQQDLAAAQQKAAAADLSAEAARVTDLLRREAARQAIEKALATLPGKLDGDAQVRLIDQSINTLGNA